MEFKDIPVLLKQTLKINNLKRTDKENKDIIVVLEKELLNKYRECEKISKDLIYYKNKYEKLYFEDKELAKKRTIENLEKEKKIDYVNVIKEMTEEASDG